METQVAPESLLDALEAMRDRFEPKDKEEMQKIVDQLVAIGTYPKSTGYIEKYCSSIAAMVHSWGARWYLWTEPTSCPHCNADLRDYYHGPPFSRVIGIEIPGQYDGVLYWQCPDCHKDFPRFKDNNPYAGPPETKSGE